jgi:hypothetical protein
MKLETRRYMNDTEIMTVVKLRDDKDAILDEIKIYNNANEVKIDKDLKWTANNIDAFLLKVYQIAKTQNIEFDSQIVNV